MDKKNLGWKNFNAKIFLVKKMWILEFFGSKNILDKKMLGSKKFWPTKILDQKILMWKNHGSQKILNKKRIKSKQNLGQQIFGSNRNFTICYISRWKSLSLREGLVKISYVSYMSSIRLVMKIMLD